MLPEDKIPVLLLSYYFPPASIGAAQRAYGFARYLNPDKYEIHVLIPSHMDSAYPPDDQMSIPEHIQIHTSWQPGLGFLRNIKKSGFQKRNSSGAGGIQHRLLGFLADILWPDKGLFWAISSYFKARKLIKKYKIQTIWSTSPLVSAHLTAFLIRRTVRVKWICDFRDFYFTHNSTFRGLSSFARMLEHYSFRYADHVSFVTPAMREIYTAAFPVLEGKTTVIWNGTDIQAGAQAIKPVPGMNTILYAGTFYGGLRNPAPLLHVMNDWIESGAIRAQDWRITIVGNLEKGLLQEFSGCPVISCLEIRGALSRVGTTHLMQEADFLWLIVPPVDSHRDTVPAKFFDYLAFRKRILAFVPQESALSSLAVEFPQVFIFDPEQADASAVQHLLRFLQDTPDTASYVESRYTRISQTRVLERILDELR